MALSRRSFFTLVGASAAGAILASPLKKFYARADKGESLLVQGFGPLVPDPNGILDLPKGFQYLAFSRTGDTMSDGNPVPNNHDGMAAFPGPKGTTILVRNHELRPNGTPAVIAPDSKKYDQLCKGGTTTLIVEGDRKLIEDFVSLAGTNVNCAGGSTPWGSWISCEESTVTPSNPGADNILGYSENVSVKHGYNFEVPAGGGLVNPVPLVAMGRFRHEAVAVDPKTGYIYQTEDRVDGCIYRFRPNQYGNLKEGILEALAIKDMPKADTATNFPVGEPKAVEWIKIEDVDPEKDTLRYEAQEKGAAIFERGEGTCFGNGEVYWTCTNGGNAGLGQIFRYDTVGDTVELFVESPGPGVLDYPDNLTLAPFGDLILCEDGFGEQFLVGVNPDGECYQFARNALNNSEFAGICFSPDGQTMFVNIYQPGITFAIWGPWNKG
ncbi:MAG: alkaline phosphatase PhoX [Xenococcaceae cyanobacterium]